MARECSSRSHTADRSANIFIWIYDRLRRHPSNNIQILNPGTLSPGSQTRLPGIFSYKNFLIMRRRIKRLVHRPEYVPLSTKVTQTPYVQKQNSDNPHNPAPKKFEAPMIQPVRKFPLSFYLFRWCILFLLFLPGLQAQQIGETFQAPYRYKLQNPTKLPNVPDSMHICVAYTDCEYPVEIAYYHICPDSPLVLS